MSDPSDISPLLVRIPAPLKTWLKARAEDNARSMTGEIVALMRAAQKQEAKEASLG
jgi:hypothetical protein